MSENDKNQEAVNELNKLIDDFTTTPSNHKSKFFKSENPFDLTKEFKSINNLLPGLMPGDTGIIFGESGVGKSYFILQLALWAAQKKLKLNLGLSKSKLWLNNFNVNRIVYINLEDSKNILTFRCRSIMNYHQYPKNSKMKNESGEHYLQLQKNIEENFNLLTSDDFEDYLFRTANTPFSKNHSLYPSTEFLEFIAEAKETDYLNQGILIIDTLSVSQNGDENNNDSMASLIKESRKIAKELNCAIIFVHHTNKLKDSGTAGIRGASAINANSRWVAELSLITTPNTTNQSKIKLSLVKANYISRGRKNELDLNFIVNEKFNGVLDSNFQNHQKSDDLKPKQEKVNFENC